MKRKEHIMKQELKQIESQVEDLSFDLSDAMDDIGGALRYHKMPSCTEGIFKNALAKLAQANFNLSGLKIAVSDSLAKK